MEITSATSTTAGSRSIAGQLPEKINDIARNIQNRLDEGPFDWDVSRGDLRAISQTLVSLDDNSRNDVISRLPDSALRKWGGEIDGWMGGLDHGERTDLFNSLAQGLDAQQLARFHGALNDNLQREFGQAIQRNTDRQTQIEFLANIQQNLLQNQGTPNTEGLSPEQIELILDLSQVALDVVGLVDPTPVSDGINGIISLFRGDFLGAGISALSMIPYVGDLAKTGKLGKWAETVDGVVRMAAKDAKFAEQVRPVLNKIRNGIEAIPQGAFDKLPEAAQDTLRHIASKIDEILGSGRHKLDAAAAAAGKTTRRIIGDNQVEWVTDAQGRLVEASATLRETFTGLSRSTDEVAAQRRVGASGIEGDVGGHAIGHRFVGDNGEINLFAQNGKPVDGLKNFNGSAFKKVENEISDWIEAGAEVRYNVKFSDFDANGRPMGVEVEYSAFNPKNGERIYFNEQDFDNAAGQTFERLSKQEIVQRMQALMATSGH